MSNFYYRTESIKKDDIQNLFVGTSLDKEIIDAFKSNSPTILEGSRGTGKSFLMRMAELNLEESFNEERILPVYISFMASTLLHTTDSFQFYNWMLAKIIRETLKALRKKGIAVNSYATSLIIESESNVELIEEKLKNLVTLYESSYKNPAVEVLPNELPDLADLIDAIEEICSENGINRISYFFDEAAHIFRPEQQRQFFTLFRDFKSPYITPNAAVYPGVTHYGDTFEMIHDATFKSIERDIKSEDFLSVMHELVIKQSDEALQKQINSQKELFNTLVLCSGGNPRILLKTIEKSIPLKTQNVENTIRNFYRSDVWSEHTLLGNKYKGHAPIIDWGRTFIEETVIPTLVSRNTERLERSKPESSLYFWIHKDVPKAINEALRLLCYTGIVRKMDSGVKATKSQIGERYELKYGCVLAQESNINTSSSKIYNNLKLDNFLEYGQNSPVYSTLQLGSVFSEEDSVILEALNKQMNEPITILDITEFQKNKLLEFGISTIKELFETNEDDLIKNIRDIGVVRARIIKNAATAEFLEYLSG